MDYQPHFSAEPLIVGVIIIRITLLLTLLIYVHTKVFLIERFRGKRGEVIELSLPHA